MHPEGYTRVVQGYLVWDPTRSCLRYFTSSIGTMSYLPDILIPGEPKTPGPSIDTKLGVCISEIVSNYRVTSATISALNAETLPWLHSIRSTP